MSTINCAKTDILLSHKCSPGDFKKVSLTHNLYNWKFGVKDYEHRAEC